MKSTAAKSKAVKTEVCDAVKFACDDDEDKAVKSEDDDNDDHDNDDHDNDNEDWMTQLSHNMAKHIRRIAYNEDLFDEDGWLPLCDALPRLHCTAAEVAKAVELSDRHDDDWGLGARFEMYISGSCTWIRATDYRHRSRRSQQS